MNPHQIKRLFPNVSASTLSANAADYAAPAPRTAPKTPQERTEAPSSDVLKVSTFTILGAPMGKPRMTQRDKWKKRPCVVRYRAWADSARAAAPKDMPIQPISVSWVAYLPLPKSWRKPLRDTMTGQLHRHKPDRDNIDKAICDALWKDDSCIAQGTLEKRWDDGNGPRIELTVTAP